MKLSTALTHDQLVDLVIPAAFRIAPDHDASEIFQFIQKRINRFDGLTVAEAIDTYLSPLG
jgi:hypothetical protein